MRLRFTFGFLAISDKIMFACEICLFKTIKKDNYLTHIAKHKDEKNSLPVEEEKNSISSVNSVAIVNHDLSNQNEVVSEYSLI